MINYLIDKVKVIANSWGEDLEPQASRAELQNFAERLKQVYDLNIPVQYENFLRTVNGLEFNGLIIYGTKNSENDPAGSQLDFFEMNEALQDSLRARMLNVIVVGEDSTGVLTYDKGSKQFQYRDRIGLDRVEQFSSFEEMLKVEIEKVM